MKRRMMIASFLAALIGLAGCQKTTIEGPEGKKLTLYKPADQVLKQGDTNQILVRINRDNFRDAVTIRFDQLPKGVELQDKDKKIAAEQNSAMFTFRADDKAAILERHQVIVSAEGPEGMKATERFNLTVKSKSVTPSSPSNPDGIPAP